MFSLFGLKPDTEYELSACGESVKFKTDYETACFNVRDFNAYGDGKHDDTPSFVAAIACLPEGGTLYVPNGTYFLTPLFLKSNITLYLEEGATLLGFPDMKEINRKVKNGGLYFQFVENVKLKNVNITQSDGEPVICEGVGDFSEE